MTSDAGVVVRYKEDERAAVEQILRRLVRKQGRLDLALGIIWGLVVVVLFGGAALSVGEVGVSFFVAVLALLTVPVLLVVLGVRQLRRQPHMPDVAVTITPDMVVFPTIERASGLFPRVPAEEWPRNETTAEILASTSMLNTQRVQFTRFDGRKRRRRTINANTIDVAPGAIVAALMGAPTP